MTHTAVKMVQINLTPEQVDAIKKQTGLDKVPKTIHLASDALADKGGDDHSFIKMEEAACGMIHELGRS
jgi:hypothetical protein